MTGVDRRAVPDDYRESPAFVDTPDGAVFGIVTSPARARGATGIVVLPGGGTPITTNRNRFSVDLCRDLAALGFTAFRMDYHGTGESSGSVDRFHLGHPFVGDVMAAISYLKGLGVERFVLVGTTCFGSRTAVAVAAGCEEADEVVALAMPLRDFAMGEGHSQSAAIRRSFARYVLEAFRPRTIKGLFDQRTRRIFRKHGRAKLRVMRDRVARLLPWSTRSTSVATGVSPRLRQELERLVDRQIPTLLVYGDDDDYYREFLAARDGVLANVLKRGGSLVNVVTVPGRVHGLTRVSVQDAVTRVILEWAEDRTSRPGRARSPAVAVEPR